MRREALMSGVENTTSTAVPRMPEAVRVSTIRSRTRLICVW